MKFNRFFMILHAKLTFIHDQLELFRIVITVEVKNSLFILLAANTKVTHEPTDSLEQFYK